MATYKLKENDLPIYAAHYQTDQILSETLLKLSERLSIVRKSLPGYIVQINQYGKTYYMETECWIKSDKWIKTKDPDAYFKLERQIRDDIEVFDDGQKPLDIIEIQHSDGQIQELYIVAYPPITPLDVERFSCLSLCL